ncbi:MAG: dipeptidase PepV [Bacillota bacterium]
MKRINDYIDAKANEMTDALAGLVRIPSVKGEAAPGMPYGEGVGRALQYALSLGKKLGFEPVNLEGHMGLVDYGEGDETLGIMMHLDVVPAGAGWNHDPFSAHIENGRMYGRGTTDNKGAVISALYALAAVKERGLPLKRRVRIMLGCDEESGWGDMAYYKQHQPLPDLAFSPDCEYPVINAEKGVLHLDITKKFSSAAGEEGGLRVLSFSGGSRVNMVPDRAEAVISPGNDGTFSAESLQTRLGPDMECTLQQDGNVHVLCHGLSAHGSTPELGKNAVCMLAAALYDLGLQPGGPANVIAFLARKMLGELGGQSIGLALRDEVSGALTINIGVLEMDEKGMSMQWDIRFPITYTHEDILERIAAAMQLPGFMVNVRHSLPPHFVSEDSELVQKLLMVYARQTGAKAYCRSIGGATYARAMENAVSFGPNMESGEHLAHQANEYVPLEMLAFNARMIADAIVTLCGA